MLYAWSELLKNARKILLKHARNVEDTNRKIILKNPRKTPAGWSGMMMISIYCSRLPWISYFCSCILSFNYL
jgi:hypothetical protein